MVGIKRRYPAILLGLGISLGSAPAPAAAPPRLVGTTTLTSEWASGAVLASLPRSVSVDVSKPASWIAMSAPGPFTALVIDQVGKPGNARTSLFFSRLARPAGCGFDGRCVPVETIAVRLPGSAGYARPVSGSLTLPAGNYRIYTVGDRTQGDRGRVFRLTLRGLTGATTLRATNYVVAGMSSWSHNGPNTAAINAHPEKASGELWSVVAPTWTSGSVGGLYTGPLYSGVVWEAPPNELLVGGVWRAVPSGSTARLPRNVSMCWEVSPRSKGLPDHWWQHPEANHQILVDAIVAPYLEPYRLRCLDGAHLGADRAFALTKEASTARFQFRGNPVVEPDERFGMFIIGLHFLDPQ